MISNTKNSFYIHPALLLLVVCVLMVIQGCSQSTFVPHSDPFKGGNQLEVNLAMMPNGSWCFPLTGAKVISPYGSRNGRSHSGVDLKTKPNDKIRAAFSGIVTMSQVFSGYGKCIIVQHPSGLETLYAHNSKNKVKVGDRVSAGQVIALTGRTGRATTEHLHFEVRLCGRHYNPQLLFDLQTGQLKRKKLIFTKNGGVSVN